MEYGNFSNDGKTYVIKTPDTPQRWYNFLFNDEYYMEISQTGQGDSISMVPCERAFNRTFRFFYIKEGECCFNPNYFPLKVNKDNFRCVHGLFSSEYLSEYNDLTTSLRVFVPLKGSAEIWTLKIKNNQNKKRELDVFSVMSFESKGMGVKTDFDGEMINSYAFPYYIKFDERDNIHKEKRNLFMYSDIKPSSYDCSQGAFFGSEDITVLPHAVINGCSNSMAEDESAVGAFEHKIILEPNGEVEINIIYGCALSVEEAKKIKLRISDSQKIEAEFNDTAKYWDELISNYHIKTPDKVFDWYMNYWLKKQLSCMITCHRLSNLSCVRNELQDALGYSLISPTDAKNYLVKTVRTQKSNGYLKQWHMIDDCQGERGLALLHHMDGNVWMICCASDIVRITGDLEFLNKQIEYKDTNETETLYNHIVRAIDYIEKNVGEHGLVLFGDGDWNDPINGAGRLGRGESVWTTMGFKYAIRSFIPIAQAFGDDKLSERLQRIDDCLYKTINDTAWDENWYIIGYDDFGNKLGTKNDAEGRLYLNTQTWAIMSGCADGDRLEKCLEAIDSLDTVCGPVILSPPYTSYNTSIGKLSDKLPGTSENGAVYCHGSMFKSMSDYLTGRKDEAFNTIKNTLPVNLKNKKGYNSQVPIFVPNYYFGVIDSPNFGKSSNFNKTGTCSWMIYLSIEYLFGIKSYEKGLKLQPNLPSDWNECFISKKYKDAVYNVTYKKSDSGEKAVFVDGIEYFEEYLPYEQGHKYEINVNY